MIYMRFDKAIIGGKVRSNMLWITYDVKKVMTWQLDIAKTSCLLIGLCLQVRYIEEQNIVICKQIEPKLQNYMYVSHEHVLKKVLIDIGSYVYRIP